MNSLTGRIIEIDTSGNLSIVTMVIHKELFLKSIVLETSETVGYLQEEKQVSVLFKETEVIIATIKDHISIENRIPVIINTIEKGILLSRIVLEASFGKIVTVISTHTLKSLQLKIGAKVYAMIKLNEIMLSEI